MDQELREFLAGMESRLNDSADARFAATETRFAGIDARFDWIDTRFAGIDTRFDLIDARFAGIDTRFDSIDARFAGIDTRFDSIDARFAGIDTRFDLIDARFAGIDARLDSIDARFAGIDARLDSIDIRLAGIDVRFEALEKTFTGKLDRAAEAFASDIGTLHEQIKAVDRTLRRAEGTITTALELLVKQSRWHEETDNAVRDLGNRMIVMERRIGDLERRLPPAA